VLNEDERHEFTRLIADDLEGGQLEKVTTLFRYNKTLYAIVGNLLRDDRMKVRLGINMLIDELQTDKPDDVKLAIPELLPLLSDESPTLRGDAADVLGMVGDETLLPELERLLNDPNHQVAEIAADAIDQIREKRNR
jgi:HEAT repeat protein